MGYTPAAWDSFGGALVAVAGALTGLLFVAVIARAGGGLYWLIPAVAASLVGGVINAWLFVVRIPS